MVRGRPAEVVNLCRAQLPSEPGVVGALPRAAAEETCFAPASARRGNLARVSEAVDVLLAGVDVLGISARSAVQAGFAACRCCHPRWDLVATLRGAQLTVGVHVLGAPTRDYRQGQLRFRLACRSCCLYRVGVRSPGRWQLSPRSMVYDGYAWPTEEGPGV